MATSKNFKSEELACTCCGESGVKQWALDKLQAIRDIVGRPLTITSAYRCSNHPLEAKKLTGKAGTHNQGIAFDIYVSSGTERHELINTGLLVGANGIGVDKNFIHLDFREATPVVWTY